MYFIVFLFCYQGFLQTVSNLFDENNLRDFTQLQKVYFDSFFIFSILVSTVDNILEFIVKYWTDSDSRLLWLAKNAAKIVAKDLAENLTDAITTITSYSVWIITYSVVLRENKG